METGLIVKFGKLVPGREQQAMSAMTRRKLAVLVTAGVLALLGVAYLAAIAPDVVQVLANRPPWLGEDEA